MASYNKNPAALNEPDGIVAVWNLHLLERPEFVFHSQVGFQILRGCHVLMPSSPTCFRFVSPPFTLILCSGEPTQARSYFGILGRSTYRFLEHHYPQQAIHIPSMRCRWWELKTLITSSQAARMGWSAAGWSICWRNPKYVLIRPTTSMS